MLPNVSITKLDGQTGVVKPATTGVLAILAASMIGNTGQPGSFTRQADLVSNFNLGPLAEYGAYFLQNAAKPVVALSPSTISTPGAYGTLGRVFGGTSVPTITSGPMPADNWQFLCLFQKGGTVGQAGITYKYSLDNGQSWSGTLALGTATVIVPTAPVVGLPTGMSFTLGAGTIMAGDTFYVLCARPQMNNADLVAALEGLRVTKLPWDGVLIDTDVTATEVATVDSWLAALEAKGIFKNAWMNTRHKTRPMPTAESESTFAAAMGTLLPSSSSIRIDVGTDGGDLPSPITGVVHSRPTSLAVATRAMSFPIGVDPAYVANGPVPGFQIADSNQNPKYHDEALYPGLDDLRLSTLRSLNGEQGVYITNANVLSPSVSDYVYDQHVRVMNAACTLAYAILTTQLSKSVRKQPPDSTTGAIYILEEDAQTIEALVNDAFATQLVGQCNAAQFVLSRTDDLSSNAGATVTGEVQIQALAYIKNFAVTAKYVKSISVPTST